MAEGTVGVRENRRARAWWRFEIAATQPLGANRPQRPTSQRPGVRDEFERLISARADQQPKEKRFTSRRQCHNTVRAALHRKKDER
jgi:hypothetical protein